MPDPTLLDLSDRDRAALAGFAEHLDAERSAHPRWADLALLRAGVHTLCGELEPAEACADAALAVNPGYGLARHLRAEIRNARGDAAGARTDALALTAGGRASADGQVATEALERHLAGDRSGPRAALGQTARRLALYLAETGARSRSTRWLELAEALDHDEAASASARGEIAFAHGEVDAAIEAFQTALARGAAGAQARVSLAYALGVRGDAEGSFAQLKAAVEEHPRYPDLRLELATGYADRGERDAAVWQLDAALELNSDYGVARYARALLYAGAGRLADARREFETARAGGLVHPELRLELVFTMLDESPEEAGALLTPLLDDADPPLGAHLGAALLAERDGELASAAKHLSRFRARAPGDGSAAGSVSALAAVERRRLELADQLAARLA